MIRPALPADFPFIRGIAGRAENAAFIADEGDAALAAHIADPDKRLVIWDSDAGQSPTGAGQIGTETRRGFALFAGLSSPANKAELRRLALDRPGAGLGRAFLNALTDHAFGPLGRDLLWLDVAADNARARRLYERAGFVYEGRLRQRWRRPKGDVVDLDLLSMTRAEWQGGLGHGPEQGQERGQEQGQTQAPSPNSGKISGPAP